MRKILCVGVMLCALVLAGAGPAFADSSTYNSSQNIYVPVYTNPAVATFFYSLHTASLTFDTQEAAHTYAVNNGAGVQHSYVVVVVNNQAVLFIDPPCYYPGGGGAV